MSSGHVFMAQGGLISLDGPDRSRSRRSGELQPHDREPLVLGGGREPAPRPERRAGGGGLIRSERQVRIGLDGREPAPPEVVAHMPNERLGEPSAPSERRRRDARDDGWERRSWQARVEVTDLLRSWIGRQRTELRIRGRLAIPFEDRRVGARYAAAAQQ